MRKAIARTGPILLILAAAGCAPAYRMTSAFEPEDFPAYLEEGSATVEGTAFIRKRYRREFGREAEVILTPASPYSEEMMEAIADYPVRIENLDPRLEDFQRRTRTDREGRFRFEGLPPGDYFLHCFIDYPVPGGLGPLQRAASVRTATARGRVRLEAGKTASAEVRADLPEVY